MRCKDCDVVLSDFEATRFDLGKREYVDLCTNCFLSVSKFINTRERFDLYEQDPNDDFLYED